MEMVEPVSPTNMMVDNPEADGMEKKGRKYARWGQNLKLGRNPIEKGTIKKFLINLDKFKEDDKTEGKGRKRAIDKMEIENEEEQTWWKRFRQNTISDNIYGGAKSSKEVKPVTTRN